LEKSFKGCGREGRGRGKGTSPAEKGSPLIPSLGTPKDTGMDKRRDGLKNMSGESGIIEEPEDLGRSREVTKRRPVIFRHDHWEHVVKNHAAKQVSREGGVRGKKIGGGSFWPATQENIRQSTGRSIESG